MVGADLGWLNRALACQSIKDLVLLNQNKKN
jgi:hypothetical protein